MMDPRGAVLKLDLQYIYFALYLSCISNSNNEISQAIRIVNRSINRKTFNTSVFIETDLLICPFFIMHMQIQVVKFIIGDQAKRILQYAFSIISVFQLHHVIDFLRSNSFYFRCNLKRWKFLLDYINMIYNKNENKMLAKPSEIFTTTRLIENFTG